MKKDSVEPVDGIATIFLKRLDIRRNDQITISLDEVITEKVEQDVYQKIVQVTKIIGRLDR